jgi:hypothetical protein
VRRKLDMTDIESRGDGATTTNPVTTAEETKTSTPTSGLTATPIGSKESIERGGLQEKEEISRYGEECIRSWRGRRRIVVGTLRSHHSSL